MLITPTVIIIGAMKKINSWVSDFVKFIYADVHGSLNAVLC